jgi:biotin transport system substrate-specific component
VPQLQTRPHALTARRSLSADIALIAVFAALIAALGVAPPVYAFGNAVPITLQTLGVMLAGSVLGARRGALAVLTFLALVAVGLPLLSGGRGGLGVFVAPSAGYLVGFVPGAYVTGALTRRFGEGRAVTTSFLGTLAATVIGGVIVVYAFGVPVQAWRVGLPLTTVAVGAGLFLVGDLAKAVISTLITRGVRRAGVRLPE